MFNLISFVLSCPKNQKTLISLTLAKTNELAVYMYFACKIVAPKMSDSLERTRSTGYLSIVTDIFVFIKRSHYTDMGRHYLLFVDFLWSLIGNFLSPFDALFTMKSIT